LTLENTTVTKVVVDAKDPSKARITVDGVYDSGVRGFTSVNITRIDVATLVKGVDTTIAVPNDAELKISAVLLQIRDQLGIDLAADEIEDEELVLEDGPDGKPQYAGNVVVKAGHPVLYGTFKISASGIMLDLSRLIVVTDVDGIKDPMSHVSKTFDAQTLTYAHDYTEVADALSVIPLGTVNSYLGDNAVAIARALSKVDGLPWITFAGVKPFTLNLARVLHHCRTVDFDVPEYSVNKDYSHVMVIQTYNPYCTNIMSPSNSGIIIHYDRLEGLE
ncbi:MAG: hypothetical protein ACRDAT_01445, partial [Cetobacterium sp.]